MANDLKVKITDNSKKFLSASKVAKEKALTQIGMKWQSNVTPLVPVDTGRLRASMAYDVQASNNQVVVGSDVEYAVYVNNGTSKKTAHNLMEKSTTGKIDDYKQIVESVFKNA